MEMHPSRGDVTPENLLAVKVTVLTSTVLARKAPILEVGLFDETFRRGHDFDLWLRLAKAGARFAYHREVLAHHRIVESGLSGGTISQLKRTLAVLEAIKSLKNGLTASEDAALQVKHEADPERCLPWKTVKKKLLAQGFCRRAAVLLKRRRSFDISWKVILVC